VAIAGKVSSSYPRWLANFRDAYSEGRLGEAATLYDQNAIQTEPAELVLLGARAHLRGSPANAIQLLVSLEFAGENRMAIERDILLGEAFARTGDFAAADERLECALNGARTLRDSELLAEIGYRYVRRHLQVEDTVLAREYLALARAGKSHAAKLNAIHAETFILATEGRVKEQAALLVEFLRLLDPSLIEFVHHRAWATERLALLAREMAVTDAIPEIERQLGGVLWPYDFAANRFQALKALGWAKALQGDYFNAFRHLKQAAHAALTPAWKVVAACDRAYLARCLGEIRWSRQELDEAEDVALTVDWHATLGEERAGLLLLAELFAGIDPAKSAAYLAQYRELGDLKSTLHAKHDARIAAFAQFSTGIVEIALNNRKRGLSELRQALKVFERFGYDFRAARCLIAEFETTGNDELLAVAAERLRNYGQSWLAAELRTLGLQPGGPVLPPMQKRVFDGICQGKSTAEIARDLGRSEFTVSNHIKQIFKAFNVGSRSSLLAEAVRRGILRSSS
jgi:DNA-binding CsgD family transcriptional regulator/tetratricopeptide (TPR) repeat protein